MAGNRLLREGDPVRPAVVLNYRTRIKSCEMPEFRDTITAAMKQVGRPIAWGARWLVPRPRSCSASLDAMKLASELLCASCVVSASRQSRENARS